MNPAPPPSDPEDIVDLPADRGFADGQPARAKVVRVAGELSREAWRQQGYPKARVSRQSVTAVHPEDYLKVYLWMAEGPYAVYGDITVEGTERMDPEFVRYMAGLIKGREFDPDDLEKARKRLERLGVFSMQRIEEAPEVLADGSLPITIRTGEKKPRGIGVGATLSTIDGAGVEAYWLHRNLFGKAERLRIDAQIAGFGNTVNYDEIDYLLGAEFTKPGVFNPDTDLKIGVTAKREVNETYTETSLSGQTTLTHYYSDELTFTGGLFAEFGEYEDTFGTRQLFTTGILTEATFDNRDNKLEPTEGFYADLKARPFYEWEFEGAGLHLELEGRSYLALGSKNTVLAGRVKLGSLAGISVTNAPPDLLFFTGGGGSVRGYGYKNIGVTEPDGSISGGRSLLEGSLELRQRVTDSFGAVAFIDVGTVGAESTIDFSEDIKVGVGAGLRYYTGLGALRLDVAVPLDPGDDDPDFGIYVGIGQAF
jgi:translocation and assembly module TamA